MADAPPQQYAIKEMCRRCALEVAGIRGGLNAKIEKECGNLHTKIKKAYNTLLFTLVGGIGLLLAAFKLWLNLL